MQLTISSLVFLALIALFNGLFAKRQPAKVDLHGRLKHVIAYEETADTRQAELSRPFAERIFLPLLTVMSALATRFLPAEILQRLEKKVLQSGRSGGFSARDYLGVKVLSAAALPSLLFAMNSGERSPRIAALIAFAAVIGWRFPDIHLDRKVRARIEKMEKTFPDTLDLLTVSVGAGLGFDGALAKVVEKSSGPVAEEFKRILHEIKMGKSRREAMRDFGERSGVDDIKTFTGAIVQADQLGLNISNTLKIQAEQMRRKRRQRVEEQAMKVPVKMLIPLIVFIFPTIFIVLLGPALIQILENFVGM